MKIVISAQQPGLDAQVDPRFGRAGYFVRVESDTDQWEAFPNPASAAPGGAGVAAAQFVVDQQAKAVISGDFGPNAANAFRSAGIEMRVFSGDVATVKDACEQFRQGKLKKFE